MYLGRYRSRLCELCAMTLGHDLSKSTYHGPWLLPAIPAARGWMDSPCTYTLTSNMFTSRGRATKWNGRRLFVTHTKSRGGCRPVLTPFRTAPTGPMVIMIGSCSVFSSPESRVPMGGCSGLSIFHSSFFSRANFAIHKTRPAPTNTVRLFHYRQQS